MMMPLAMAKRGATVVIRKITGKDSIRQHLAELGLVVDESVTVVSELGGNIIFWACSSMSARYSFSLHFVSILVYKIGRHRLI